MNLRLFGAVAVGAVLACQGEPLAPSTSGGLTLSLALSSVQLQRGESDSIAVSLTNRNRNAVSLSAGGCPLLFYVTDARGATVVPSGGDWICIAIISRIILAPGAQQTQTFLWETHAVPPGRYAVFGMFVADGIRLATTRAAVDVN